MPRYNPSSSARGGFDYQDLWALSLCGDMLEDSNRFVAIRFESAPDEIDDSKFTLDDIILRDADSRYHFFQVKSHAGAWSWEELLHQKPDKRSHRKALDSLLKRWSKSAVRPEFVNTLASAVLLTDGQADQNILSVLQDGHISLNLLRSTDKKTHDIVVAQLGDESAADAFFKLFTFKFGCPPIGNLETSVRNRLSRNIGVTDAGFNSLFFSIKRESRKPLTDQWFTLDDLRSWCDFSVPRSLSQDFTIPPDFQLFDRSCHRELLKTLRDPSGGVQIIYGKPGSGKSTYAAQLYRVLTRAKVPVFRHHFFLSTDDPESSLRLTSNRATEALKAQFMQQPELFGKLARRDSKEVSVQDYLSEIASTSFEDGKAFVLIIDGLDHVLRSGDAFELRTFLSEISALQRGYWLILIAQESAETALPGQMLDACPRSNWLAIPGIDEPAVERLITKNHTELTLPTQPDQLQALTHRLFSMTEGNPLHLRYSLHALKNHTGSTPVHAWDCDSLLPFEGDIAKYYSSLWDRTSSTARQLLIAVAILKVRLTATEIHSLAGSFDGPPKDISDSISQSKHLLRDSRTGVSIYHNSFEVFLASTHEFTQQREKISRTARDWASKSAAPELKWFLVPMLGYEMGEPQDILSLDKSWLAEAILKGRPAQQITMLLRRAVDAAVKDSNFGLGITLTGLASYHENALQFLDTDAERLWAEALWHGEINVQRLDISTLQTLQVDQFARYADQNGLLPSTFQELEARLEQLHAHLEIRTRDQFPTQIPQVPVALISLVSRDREHEVERVLRYLEQFRTSGWSPELTARYAIVLLETRQIEKLQKLLSSSLSEDERSQVQDSLIRYDLSEYDQRIVAQLISSAPTATSFTGLLWKHLNGTPCECLPPLPSYDAFPTQVPEYDTDARRREAVIFADGFTLGILYDLTGNAASIDEWIKGAESRWSLNIMAALLRAAITISKTIQAKGPVPVDAVFTELATIPPLEYPRHRELYQLQLALSATIRQVLQTCVVVENAIHSYSLHDQERLLREVPWQYFSRSDCLRFCLDQPRAWLTDVSAQGLIDAELRTLAESIDTFSDRTTRLLDLAQLARIHHLRDLSVTLRTRAAKNFLGYGYHKDMYLYDVMNMIRISHCAGSRKGDHWIRRIAPIVMQVGNFTDGDETYHFPNHLGEIMAEVSPSLLRSCYFDTAQQERLTLAQDLFASILQHSAFDTPEQIGLAATAIDESGLTTLRRRAEDSTGAHESAQRIEAQLGEIRFPNRSESTPYTPTEHSFPPPQDVPPESLSDFAMSSWEYSTGRQFLPSWRTYWLAQPQGRQRVYHALERLADLPKLRHSVSEVLDLLFPVAFEFDPEKSFQSVCRAQSSAGGWQSYWTDMEQSRRRWEFIKSHFPSRAIEFFMKSTESASHDGHGMNTYVPLTRAAEFFALFNRLDVLEQVTEAAIEFVESLVSDLALPEPAWLSMQSVDFIDLLLQRLVWPSPLVRERSATELAELLLQPETRTVVFDKLLTWIASQKLETTVAIGLLPVLRAAEKQHTTSADDLQRLCDLIPITSPVIRALVIELSDLTGTQLTVPERPGQCWPLPVDYQISHFFDNYKEALLPPVYLDRLRQVETATSARAVDEWAYECQRLSQETGVQESIGEIPSFARDAHSWTVIGVAPLLSEVYRSAFLRVITSLNERGLISDPQFLDWSYGTCPIDLSYWGIRPIAPPTWWPTIIQPQDGGTPDSVIKLRLEPSPSCSIEDQESLPLAFEGAALIQNRDEPQLDGMRLSVVAFGYAVQGPDIPSPKVLYDLLGHLTMYQHPDSHRPLRVIDSIARRELYVPFKRFARVKDLLVAPLVARVHTLAISHWQPYRAFGLLTPCPWLLGNSQIDITQDAWTFLEGDRTLVSVTDWTQGVGEREYVGIPTPWGIALNAHRDGIMDQLRTKHLKLAHVLKTVYTMRKNTYEDPLEHEEYQLLGLSPIITDPHPIIADPRTAPR